MQSAAKIQLSKDEIELAGNTEWILTKHSIIKKVYAMFGEISEIIKDEVSKCDVVFPENTYNGGKISKGDNYRLLPYVILDYPSFFVKDNIFAVRSMFWWGHFFSITLHLSGHHKLKYINYNPALLQFLKEKSFFICTNDDEWQHHFEKDNYTPTSDMMWMQFKGTIDKGFYKVAKKIPITEWDNALMFFKQGIAEIIQFLQISSPACKKDL